MPNFQELMQSMANRLILINVLVFFGVQQMMFAGARTGFELYYFAGPHFEFWQLISHMFLHSGPMHLAFNMLALWSFGRILEQQWGETRFLIFYLVCGVGAALVSFLVDYFIFGPFWGATLGASGAVYGLLLAFAMLYPNFKIMLIFLPVPVAAKHFVPILLLIDLTGGVTGFSIFGSNIAHFAHLGGALFGFLMVLLYRRI